MKLYKTITRSVMSYATETMTLTQKELDVLTTSGMKTLRKTLRKVKVSKIDYRTKTNCNVGEEIKGETIVNLIKLNRRIK